MKIKNITLHKCDDCGNYFLSIDITENGVLYLAPRKCRKCRSTHIYKAGLKQLFGLAGPKACEKDLWKRNDMLISMCDELEQYKSKSTIS